jgi:y4mF family transcriptional regulator
MKVMDQDYTTSTSLSLSQFVKKKRKALGLTQEKLADKAGVGLRFLRELERDKPTLQLDKVNQVLFLFGYELGPVPVDRKKLIDAAG